MSFSRLMSAATTSGSRAISTARRLRTAAMMVIGDEVLNGKIKDTNSQFFAQFCFETGLVLRRIAVVPDEKEDIVDTINSLRSKYDFIVTTGGIGPTHDDITYESLAAAYGLPLKIHQPTVDRMNKLAKNPPNSKPDGSPEQIAQLRMALFPDGQNVIPHFLYDRLWVPVVSLDEQVYVFPGIPSLYQELLEGLRPSLLKRIDSPKLIRRYVSTRTPESELAPILTQIQRDYADREVKVGSYPHWNIGRNTVSLIAPASESQAIQDIVEYILPKVNDGREVSATTEAEST